LTTTDDLAESGSEELTAHDSGFDFSQLGERLREARTGKRWSRGDVERLSAGRWTATVIGTYERAERMLTAVNLFRLADLYGVPVENLIGCDPPQQQLVQVRELIVIDTRRLQASPDWPWLAQFARGVQLVRAGRKRRYLRLRRRDVPRLAAIYSETVDRLLADLAEAEILVDRAAVQTSKQPPTTWQTASQ
jgi:transcriptional regulator with XRE-family HTH domain